MLPEDAIVVPVPSVLEESAPASAQNVQSKQEEQKPQSALARIPKNEQGEPVYEQTDAETAWDAIMEQTEGDAEMAAAVVASTIADKQKALEDAQTAEIPQGATVQEKIAAQKTHKQNIESAQKELAHWQEIAGVEAKRAEMAAHGNNEVSKMQEAETEAVEPTEIRLSDELDENGRQFVLNSEGNISFGEIGDETGLPSAPILLSEGMITNPETNDGYGLVHIEARHGEQIRNAGYKSVVEFIEEVAKNYEVIREGANRRGHQTYLLQLRDKHNNTLMVELSTDGTYWNINTAGIFKTSYGRNRKEVYNRHTTAKQPTETAEASQNTEQSGTTVNSSMNAPTSSADKVTESSAATKETAGNISETAENVTGTEQNEAEQTSAPAREGEVSTRMATPTEIINEYKEPLRRVARNWGKKLGVKVHVLESLDEVSHTTARDQIVAAEAKKQNVPGWYDRETGEVYIYMPHVNSMKDITSTLVHEVVSHHGLKALLGEKGYDRLCDQVYKMLPLSERKKWLKYPGVNGNHRKAADEYIAHLSEGVRNIGTERSVWQKIVAFVRKALRDMGLELEASDRELEGLLRASYADLRSKAEKNGEYLRKNGEGKANHVGKGKKIAEKNRILTAYDESAGDNTSAISDANQGKAAPTPANSVNKGTKNISFRKAKDANNLVAVHNISEQDLRRVFEMGSLIMPSIAITDVNIGHSGYGEISLLFDKETINPTDRRNKVYGGDAWTPRFPQMVPKLKGRVLRSVREKIYGLLDAATRELYSLSAELHPSNIEDTISRNGIPGYYGKEYMKIAYLLDNGKRFKIPMKEKDYGIMAETVVKLAKEKSLSLSEIKNGSHEFYEKNPEFVAAVQEAKVEQRLGGIPAEQREAVRKMLLENPIRFITFDTHINQALSLEYDLEHGGKKQIVDKTALYDTINKRVKTDNADYNKWVDGLFEGVVEKYGIRNKRDWYTSSGNSRTWEQLYDAATPGNILRHMLAENEQGGSGGLWDSNIMGASAETYESIDEIREKGKERLKRIDDKEYLEWSESVANRLSEICNEFMSQSQKDEFGGFIDAKIAITNAVAKDKSAKGIYKEMRKEYPKFTMEHAKIVEDVVKEIQNQAIGYFEAKPQRIVPLSEVRKAVVPSNVGSDIVEELEKNGVEVATYRKGNEQARQRAVKKASNDIRFRVSNDNQEIFVSNAQRAVEGIKQEKGTPQQWLAMIEKNGGMKAGEDKWLGLSDWLKGMDKKSVTKQEILDFIGENRIRIEEVVYKEIEEDEAWEEYKGSEEGSSAIIEQFESDAMDYAQRQVYYDDYETEEEYQDAVDRAVREYREDPWGTYFDAAEREVRRYWEAPEGINPTRLTYTTEGLENKQEIALTVPTIEPWNESDEIHFGDAGGGRAVAWVRFGDAYNHYTVEDAQEVTEFHEPYKNVNGRDVYRPVGSFKTGDYVVHGKARNGEMIYVVFVNNKQIPVAHSSLEEARNAMNEYYKAHPRTLRKVNRVLVIDEIQSKRHQEGREKGYSNPKVIRILDRLNAIQVDLSSPQSVPEEVYTEKKALEEELENEFENENPQLKNLSEQIEEKEVRLSKLQREKADREEDEKVEMLKLLDRQLEIRNVRDYDYYESEINKIKENQERREEEIDQLLKDIRMLNEEYSRHFDIGLRDARKGVMPAPFEKNWHELAMKRMMRYAAENGYDKVAWTTGAQQSERYNLSSVVDHISYIENEDGTLDARAYFPYGGYQPIGKTWEEVAENVGKDIAKRMQEGASEGTEILTWGMGRDGRNIDKEYKTLSSGNFSIGGEGMKGFYDKILPSFVSKYVKKWGAKVGEVELPEVEEAGQKMWSVDITPEMKADVMEGQVMFSVKEDDSIDAVNEKFNSELQQQIDGTLPAGHVYYLGMPSGILLSTGFPNMRIELSSSNLQSHATDPNHPFELKDVMGLPEAISKPIAVFAYGNKEKSQNLIVEIEKDGKKFLAGIHFNKEYRGAVVSDIRGIFPKDTHEWFNWIIQGKMLYENKEKIQTLIAQQRINPAEVSYLDLDSVAKIVEEFENPPIPTQEISSESENLTSDNEISFRFTEEEQSIIDEAKKNGTYMKAPNGKPTNLNEKQWAQVRTKDFKKWFGDWENDPANASKIIDENGEPKVVYHGTLRHNFTVFKNNGGGIYFTPDKDAADYGLDAEPYEVFVNMRDPMNLDFEGDVDNEATENHDTLENEYKNAIAEGYDGVVAENAFDGENEMTQIVVHRSNQIKSATENNGEFSKENNDIRFSVKPIGGNRGYVGYSMSKRAAQARGEGRFPKTDFKKEYGVSDKALDFLVASGVVDNSEWHHTSMYGNKTTFYGWSDASYPDYYAEHKAEIDNVAREYASAEGDVRKSLREDMQGKFGAAEEAWHEADRLRREQEHEKWLEKVEYEKYVRNLGVPSEYEASNGVRVVTQGSGSPYSWRYYWGEEPAFRKYARAAEEELKQHLKENKPTPLSFEEWKEKNGGVSFSVKEGRLTKNIAEENFGGIWIEDKKEFAKFASAVINNGIEENGEGVTYTDNFFYAYYRNINGDAIPFASVYLNSQESQDVVNYVNSRKSYDGRPEGVRRYIDRAIARAESIKTAHNVNNRINNSTPNSRGDGSLGSEFSRKGRYFDNPGLYVKTERADRFGLIDEEDNDLSFRTAPSFKDGEQLPIQGEKGAYFVEGLTGDYQNADYLLDAFRSKYPEYLAELNEDKTAIVVEPWSKYLGPTTSKKAQAKQDAHRERVAKSVKQAVRDAAEKLHIPVALTTSDKQKGKRAKAKGWYDTKTHEIVIVVDNHSSVHDALATVLHISNNKRR